MSVQVWSIESVSPLPNKKIIQPKIPTFFLHVFLFALAVAITALCYFMYIFLQQRAQKGGEKTWRIIFVIKIPFCSYSTKNILETLRFFSFIRSIFFSFFSFLADIPPAPLSGQQRQQQQQRDPNKNPTTLMRTNVKEKRARRGERRRRRPDPTTMRDGFKMVGALFFLVFLFLIFTFCSVFASFGSFFSSQKLL